LFRISTVKSIYREIVEKYSVFPQAALSQIRVWMAIKRAVVYISEESLSNTNPDQSGNI
jgi:hypothetical protein